MKRNYFTWCDHIGGTGWYVISRSTGCRVFVARLKTDAERECKKLNQGRN